LPGFQVGFGSVGAGREDFRSRGEAKTPGLEDGGTGGKKVRVDGAGRCNDGQQVARLQGSGPEAGVSGGFVGWFGRLRHL
jgi:hypothetical protein